MKEDERIAKLKDEMRTEYEKYGKFVDSVDLTDMIDVIDYALDGKCDAYDALAECRVMLINLYGQYEKMVVRWNITGLQLLGGDRDACEMAKKFDKATMLLYGGDREREEN